MQTHLYIRTTNHYRPEYSYLDESEFLATVGVYQEPDPVEDDGENVAWNMCATIPHYVPPTERHKYENALYDTLYRGCTCEHDCCGHFFGGPRNFNWHGGRCVTFTLALARNI